MSTSAPSPEQSQRIRVGLLGCGTVGSAVARELLARTDIELVHVAVRDPSKPRPVALDPGLLTTDALGVALEPDVDLIVEAIGGVSPTIDFVSAALLSGKPVVTANKELLASPCGSSVFEIAERSGAPLFYEGAVGGGVPIVRALETSLRGDRVLSIQGVLNGTTNYILDRLSQGTSFDEALLAARSAGFAEEDPAADISGRDAAAKITLLGSVAFGQRVTIDQVETQGIEDICTETLSQARTRGNSIKLVATATRSSRGITLSVAPVELPGDDVLARVRAEENAIVIDTELAGRLVFSGPGAGGPPTSSAVMGDVLAAVAYLDERLPRKRRDTLRPLHKAVAV